MAARPALLLPLLLLACAAPPGQRVTPQEYERIEQSALAASVLDQAEGSRSERAREDDLEDRGRELAERRDDVRFRQSELQHERERLAVEHERDAARLTVARHRAMLELEHAKTAVQSFDDEVEPRRLAEDALALQRSEDGLLELREELAQLELMYAGSELGEGTAEIVMERSRRRILRAEAAHALRQRESKLLVSVELPQERERLVMDMAEKEVAAANAERALALGEMERAAALRELAHREDGVDRELAQIERDALALEQDRRESERVGMVGGGGRDPQA